MDEAVPYENQEPKEEDGFHTEEQKASLQVLARDGGVLRKLEGIDGIPIAISADGRRVLLRVRLHDRAGLDKIELDGNRLCTIALSDYDGTVVVARDLSAVVIVRSNINAAVEWYALR